MDSSCSVTPDRLRVGGTAGSGGAEETPVALSISMRQGESFYQALNWVNVALKELDGRGFKTELIRQKAGAQVRDHWEI